MYDISFADAGKLAFTRGGIQTSILPLGCPKSNQGDGAVKTAELILRHITLGMLWYF